jgi:TonB family protein
MAVKKRSMRAYTLAALIALSFGVIVFSAPLSRAQEEQPEGKRAIVNRVVPVYPDLARRAQIHGTVRVGVVVTPSGKAKFTQVIGGNPLLAKAAVDAIEKWKWVPAAQETKELVELNFHP